jgi:hypothetical protein
MAVVYAAPNFERTGVVAGFVLLDPLLPGSLGRSPQISGGVLFAQGVMYRTHEAFPLEEAPANQQSWLFRHSVGGFYWASTPTPSTEGDAFLGWVICDADRVVACSRQEILVPAAEDNVTVIPLGDVLSIEGLPDTPVFMIAGTPGGLEFFAPSFVDLSNARTIRSATFTVWAWDETAPVRTTTTGAIDEDDTSIGTADLSGFSEGDYAVLDREILRLDNFVGSTADIERAQLETTAASHLSGARLIRLAPTVFTFSFAEGFFLGTGAGGPGDWHQWILFRDMRMCAAECYVTNALGDSEVGVAHYTDTVDYGVRTLSRGQVDIQVEGVIGIQSDAAPAIYLAETSSVLDLWAFVKEAPDGEDIEIDVKVGGTVIATLTIEDGATSATAIDGRDLDAIAHSDPITIDITKVGTTFPGEELVVRIRL